MHGIEGHDGHTPDCGFDGASFGSAEREFGGTTVALRSTFGSTDSKGHLDRANAECGQKGEESSTGDKVNRGGITKAGNGRARRILVEAAWSYRYPPRVSREKQPKVAAAPRRVREIAWKAQTRLCFRSLVRKGKRPTIAATAIARELSAFIWAINREIIGNRQSIVLGS